MHQVIYLMGVAGSGKTTIGKELSRATAIPFFDGDDFHPAANVEKMSSGQALNDEDRQAWLESIAIFVKNQLVKNSLILACSALKQRYRDILEKDIIAQTRWVYLQGDFNLIKKRMQARSGHFMPTDLLASQFADLEEPANAISVSIHQDPEQIIQFIREQLTL